MTNKRGLLLATVVTLAAFGPYVVGDLRTEQIVVYALAGSLGVLALTQLGEQKHLVLIAVGWAVYVLVVLIGAVAPPFNRSAIPVGESAAGGMDNAVLPLAVMLLALGMFSIGANPALMLDRVAAMTVLAMCLNAAAAIAQLQFGVQWSAFYGTALESTADRAATSGRYSGLINQPAEAGVLYGVALLCAIYLLSNRARVLFPVVLVIIVGGVLTVSKIFLLVGLPLAALALVRARQGRTGRVLAGIVLALLAWAVAISGILPAWTGVDQLRRLVPTPTDDFVAVFTANRYGIGETGTLSRAFDAVLNGPWPIGYGARGLQLPYDSGWVEALVVAGVLGVLCQAAVFVALFRMALRMPTSLERTLFLLVLALLAVASLGLPALTANRVATVVWLLLSCLVALSRSGSSGDLAHLGAVESEGDGPALPGRGVRPRHSQIPGRVPSHRPHR